LFATQKLAAKWEKVLAGANPNFDPALVELVKVQYWKK
jgi:hypothetical protein